MATVLVYDDYSPRYQHDMSHPLYCYFYDHRNNPITLTGVTYANCVLYMRNRATANTTIGEGTWAPVPANDNNVASYSWHANDVDTVGMFDIQASIAFVDGMLTFDPKPLEFQARI